MSTIYNDLYQDLEPKRYVRGSTPDPLYLEAGLALETILEQGLRERLQERPGEVDIIVDGQRIIASPDLIIYNSHVRVGEIKLTWMSMSEMPMEPGATRFHPKFDKYVTQMACYCHILSTPYARLIGFFVNGTYDFLKKDGKGKPPKPTFWAWDIEFTPAEIAREWNACINHARHKRLL